MEQDYAFPDRPCEQAGQRPPTPSHDSPDNPMHPPPPPPQLLLPQLSPPPHFLLGPQLPTGQSHAHANAPVPPSPAFLVARPSLPLRRASMGDMSTPPPFKSPSQLNNFPPRTLAYAQLPRWPTGHLPFPPVPLLFPPPLQPQVTRQAHLLPTPLPKINTLPPPQPLPQGPQVPQVPQLPSFPPQNLAPDGSDHTPRPFVWGSLGPGPQPGCKACRRRGAQCSNTQPCTACIARGTRCVFSGSRRASLTGPTQSRQAQSGIGLASGWCSASAMGSTSVSVFGQGPTSASCTTGSTLASGSAMSSSGISRGPGLGPSILDSEPTRRKRRFAADGGPGHMVPPERRRSLPRTIEASHPAPIRPPSLPPLPNVQHRQSVPTLVDAPTRRQSVPTIALDGSRLAPPVPEHRRSVPAIASPHHSHQVADQATPFTNTYAVAPVHYGNTHPVRPALTPIQAGFTFPALTHESAAIANSIGIREMAAPPPGNATAMAWTEEDDLLAASHPHLAQRSMSLVLPEPEHVTVSSSTRSASWPFLPDLAVDEWWIGPAGLSSALAVGGGGEASAGVSVTGGVGRATVGINASGGRFGGELGEGSGGMDSPTLVAYDASPQDSC